MEAWFGSIPEKYKAKDGTEKTSWSPSGHKIIFDNEKKKVTMFDARTGKAVFFFPPKDKEKSNSQAPPPKEQPGPGW